jgi:hypothetical protein
MALCTVTDTEKGEEEAAYLASGRNVDSRWLEVKANGFFFITNLA